jgi:hypothetical protein
MDSVFLGFDPGGIGAFGWCYLVVAEGNKCAEIKTGICSDAGETFAAVSAVINDLPPVIGVASPLYWSPDAEREADRIVRGSVLSLGGRSNTVTSVNALNGACLAQGVMVAALARERWPEVAIAESHPEALLIAWSEASSFFSGLTFVNDHERNAALAAYSAHAYHTRREGWRDLRALESRTYDPISGPPPVYWFPAGNR